jgi:FG-GAP repeat
MTDPNLQFVRQLVGPQQVVAGDFDGDGVTDLAVTGGTGWSSKSRMPEWDRSGAVGALGE